MKIREAESFLSSYSIGRDGDEAADVERRRVDGRRHPPLETGVVGRGDHVNPRHVLVHRRQDQL